MVPAVTRDVPAGRRTWRASSPVDAVRRSIVRHPDVAALVLVLGVATALRLVFFPRAPVFIGGDSSQYYVPAAALLNGEGFPLPLKRPPLYPLFVALVGWLSGGDLRAVVALQHVLGAATAGLVYGVGRLTFGRGVGVLSGLAAALSGGLLIYEHYILTEGLFTFLLTLGIFLFLVGLRGHGEWYVAGGLALGLATLTRPHAIVLLLLGPLVVGLCERRWRPAVRAGALAGAAAALVIVPWTVRNGVVHGAFTIVGATGQNLIFKTANLHHGQFVFYDRADSPADIDPRQLQARRLIQRRADEKAAKPTVNVSNREIHAQLMKDLNVGEAEADALMRDAALNAIRARPLTYARLVGEDLWQISVGVPDRLSYHWNLRERSNGPRGLGLSDIAGAVTPEQRHGFPVTEALVNIYQSPRLGPVLPALFLLGLIAALARPAWHPALLPGLGVLGLHGIGAAAVGFVARFHHPPDPLVHVLAFGGLLFAGRLLVAGVSRGRAPAGRGAIRLPAGSAPR
jgi:hypothetical protein